MNNNNDISKKHVILLGLAALEYKIKYLPKRPKAFIVFRFPLTLAM